MENTFTLRAAELLLLQEKMTFLNQERKKLELELKGLVDNKTFSANGYTYTVNERLGSIQYKDIPELESVNLDLYRGAPVVTWKLAYVKQFDI